MTIWWVVLGCILTTAVIKAAGPVALGGRELPPWFRALVASAAPALLAALVAVAVLSDGQRWSAGADTVGVAAAGLVLWRRGSLVGAVVVAVAVTAGIRLLT
ncbi:AzlD domain-containing protein [Nocardioidaceae bacterium]|nr:AzlD domain-containing protein [Nocardioidaceae bacterium]